MFWSRFDKWPKQLTFGTDIMDNNNKNNARKYFRVAGPVPLGQRFDIHTRQGPLYYYIRFSRRLVLKKKYFIVIHKPLAHSYTSALQRGGSPCNMLIYHWSFIPSIFFSSPSPSPSSLFDLQYNCSIRVCLE